MTRRLDPIRRAAALAGRLVILLGLPLLPAAASAARTPAPGTVKVVARDPAGHGLLCRTQGKTILMLAGTPEQMGAAQGVLLKDKIRTLTQKTLYFVGAGYSLKEGKWFFDRMAEVERRAEPHLPKRFRLECDAMSKAAGVPLRDGRYGNLFPEMFHCSGIAVRGKATRDGTVIHARVLDYMRDIGLQSLAVVTVFMPTDRNNWMTLGYAGFIGTVTAINEKGLAIGEMGGRGEGDWDGVPMSFLLRDVMERAGTVAEAVRIVEESPRTCEYYYVLSDKSRDMAGLYCTSKRLQVLRPGEQVPRLPFVPEDSVIISGDKRAEHISKRIQEAYGKIDVAAMKAIIKRPVAMSSNLHNAIFTPETLDMWVADAGKRTPACDEPYVRCNLAELAQFYEDNKTPPRPDRPKGNVE